ncbi:MAG: hypothetical protein KJ069_19960 [Anaerolineae bacterium]|nr:hypothetical protein [Anaerolineae bacterium]
MNWKIILIAAICAGLGTVIFGITSGILGLSASWLPGLGGGLGAIIGFIVGYKLFPAHNPQ